MSRKNIIVHNHGVLSSRLEAMMYDESVLRKLSIAVIGVDRPYYGQSDPHPLRSLTSFAADLEASADHLLPGRRFFLAGASGGGPYALAAATRLHSRMRGVLLISPASHQGLLSAEEKLEWQRHNPSSLIRAFRQLSSVSGWLSRAVAALAETPLGGRVLYDAVVKPAIDGLPSKVADVDRACLEQRPHHMQATVPEGSRQRTAAALFTDAALIGAAWPFNVTADIGPELGRAVHVWQGGGDRQLPEVGSRALSRAIPGSHLHEVPNGGHFAYFSCDLATQRRALQALLATALPA
ncbi:hypothetical protein WJX81_005940 [Elliptochloris bilobata]|uniref:AB hydrolase-1 domain-containing protein n=1 Tax=Elliptochloris bilobata TaxID=381761 RepID=A0AAW1RUZ6_9CHLO